MIAANNETLYSMGGESGFLTAALYSYSVFYMVTALLGNVIVLLATSKYKAIKLDRITVTIIQHIALCDIGNVLFSFIPGYVSFISKKWVLGRVMGYVRVYAGVLFALSGSLLVCGLNVSKLSILLNPLGRSHVPKAPWKCHLSVMVLWLISAMWPVSQLFVEPGDFYFDYRIMICMYAYTAPVWRWLAPLCLTIVIIIPTVVVIVTTTWLLVIAYQHRKSSLQLQSILTLVLIAGVYCVSFLPHAIYYIFSIGSPHFVVEKKFIPLPSGEILYEEYGADGLPMSGFLYTKLCSFGNMMLTVNNFSNFFVYYFSITSFREFIKSQVKLALCMVPGARGSGSRYTTSHDSNVAKRHASRDSNISGKFNVTAPGKRSHDHISYERNKTIITSSQ